MVFGDDFYEDDEPIEDIRAILQRPVDAVTEAIASARLDGAP